MIRRDAFGQYRYYRPPAGNPNENFGNVGLALPLLLLITVVGSAGALYWWKKRDDDQYEIIEEEIDVSPLEGSESLRAVEQTIARRKKTKRRR